MECFVHGARGLNERKNGPDPKSTLIRAWGQKKRQ